MRIPIGKSSGLPSGRLYFICLLTYWFAGIKICVKITYRSTGKRLFESVESQWHTIHDFPLKFAWWLWLKLRLRRVQLQWHSRLARRTYKSVLTKKCEGREFEPLLEHGFPMPYNNQQANNVHILYTVTFAQSPSGVSHCSYTDLFHEAPSAI